jgi:glutaredoxin
MITLYSTSDCHLCKKVEVVLDELNIEYVKAYLDKQNSGIYKASLRRRGITILAVPVIIAGEKIYRQNDLIDKDENVKRNAILSMREYEL